MHVSRCRTDISKQMSFGKLTGFHKCLETLTNSFINSDCIEQ